MTADIGTPLVVQVEILQKMRHHATQSTSLIFEWNHIPYKLPRNLFMSVTVQYTVSLIWSGDSSSRMKGKSGFCSQECFSRRRFSPVEPEHSCMDKNHPGTSH